jgi:hypothetical protein
MTIVDELQQKQQPPPAAPALETLQQKIDEFANTIIELHTIYRERKKTIIQQLAEIKILASDLNVDNTRLRDMISQSFTMMGVSESWLRKLLPEYLKSTKHTRKDYLELQQQRDQQTLQQQQRQQESAELTSSSTSTRHPALEQQQPSDDDDEQTARMRTYNNNVIVIPQTQNEQTVVSEDKDTIIKNLEKKIEQLQEEIRYLRDGSTAQRQQEEETFIALGCLELQNNDLPIRVTVNVKSKSIECMEIANEMIHEKSY